MDPKEFKRLVEGERSDSRAYYKVPGNDKMLYSQLCDALGCMVRVKTPECYKPGGILVHVDKKLRYMYVKKPYNDETICLQMPKEDRARTTYYVLPQMAEEVDEAAAWQSFLDKVPSSVQVTKLP